MNPPVLNVCACVGLLCVIMSNESGIRAAGQMCVVPGLLRVLNCSLLKVPSCQLLRSPPPHPSIQMFSQRALPLPPHWGGVSGLLK